ncbi:MAG: endonuclease MutS2 [Bacillota bacterium]|jgi:DNA mismatch repair protein MutS2|nr:endonuclease MutS2 [Clostridiales bacterium UBA9857]HOA70473.1 endonuclease MutS2 [Bacillota bacterium]HPT35234.1 endonuclease MutS2 [Bacillota bacterium]HPZ85292.1 endonuclease MutS2 [Bacillota bacterium]HQD86537.1 endonuclease MutS2 [Bacillota bacterium]
MDQKTLELLEYEKIQEMLAAQADTPMGRRLAKRAFPVDVHTARHRQKVGREIAQALGKTSLPVIPQVRDVTNLISGAMQGAQLAPHDLRDVLNLLVACDTVSSWIGRLNEDFRQLHALRRKLPQQPLLRDKLAGTVDEQGEIKDTASPKLQSIRKSYRDAQERLRKRAEAMTRQPGIAQYLQEPIVTFRNGRYVLPVKQEYASKIQGIVHDHSASGQTVFLEPSELLEMANQVRRLELLERDEIERILSEVSAWIGQVGPELIAGIEALGEFDLGVAKARLASKWNGCFPTLTDDFAVSLVRAWHPLLKGDPVPLDIHLDETGVRTVVVTGPNMGGKTVSLKTCGLLVAMALAGMPCPCDPKTQIGDIKAILCDIGDEQSIEANLSTFSAHITNIKHILAESGRGKLVLIDELGAGTDPKEGAALAQAILEKIHNSGALCVVTSHYGELKILAEKTQGMANASMEWDSLNMVPTFRLVVGRPGRSHAFLVAKRLGLDEDVLDRAKELIPEDVIRLEDIIADMEAQSQRAREEAERAAAERAVYQELRSEYEHKLSSLEAQRKKVLRDARREAQSIIARAKVEFEKALQEIKDSRRQTSGDFHDTASKIRSRLARIQADLTDPEDELPAGEPLSIESLEAGMQVMVSGFSEPGTVLEVSGSDDVVVQIGNFKLRTEISRLTGAPQKTGRREPLSGVLSAAQDKALNVSPRVDLRGMTKEEALMTLDKYIDDALLAAIPEITIIHGKGTGTLRQAVEEYLKSNQKYIAGYRLGEPSEGGTGVTIARLKT